MTLDVLNLNLARKWRSRTFEEIVGQPLVVRMLKNSLYLGHYFPVYLCAGQRGCGKTSTARIFATAVNCQALADFQKKPKEITIPCLQCPSCIAMAAGKHPDIIEIDAASHTGVDHVRQIIEAASFLPVLGKKKIYLIDEAHMLSKAAFNAFLKLLEEPPASVLFILATTDMYKILDTVRSRSFQLFFKAIQPDDLSKHLVYICKQESFVYQEDALMLIAQHTQGSARDALNVLEQVRFSAEKIDRQSVLNVLGQLSQEQLVQLLNVILNQTPQELLVYIKKIQIESFDAVALWQAMVEMFQAALWHSYRVDPVFYVQYKDEILAIIEGHSVDRINNCLQVMYDSELSFLKTGMQHQYLQMLFIGMCQKGGTLYKKNDNKRADVSKPIDVVQKKTELKREVLAVEVLQSAPVLVVERKVPSSIDSRWNLFVEQINLLGQSLISSIFQQMQFKQYNQEEQKITVTLPKKNLFFTQMLDETKQVWDPLLVTIFGNGITLDIELEEQPQSPSSTSSEQLKKKVSPDSDQGLEKPAYESKHVASSRLVSKREKTIDVSDASVWHHAHRLLKFFPGRITEVSGEMYG